MTSERAYVWTWLPGKTTPVVAGYVEGDGKPLRFAYAQSYLERDNAIALGPELPLGRGLQEPGAGLDVAGALRDGAPDGWGQGVIRHRLGMGEDDDLSIIQYMLRSGSNRFGALDFQADRSVYEPRQDDAPLADLLRAAEALEAGETLTPALEAALVHGSSIGGARPKATVIDESGAEYLAKFPSSSDRLFAYVNTEAAMLALARRVGIDVPDWKIVTADGKDVLLIERFDRPGGGTRRHVLSGLTLAREHEMTGHYVTYPGLYDVLRENGDRTAGRRLFRRVAFNMAISNSDDHARNHAAFWDGKDLSLTPAYDLAPGRREGESASQSIAYGRDGMKRSSHVLLAERAEDYGLSAAEGAAIIDEVTSGIETHWEESTDEARLTQRDKTYLWGRQILNRALRYA